MKASLEESLAVSSVQIHHTPSRINLVMGYIVGTQMFTVLALRPAICFKREKTTTKLDAPEKP